MSDLIITRFHCSQMYKCMPVHRYIHVSVCKLNYVYVYTCIHVVRYFMLVAYIHIFLDAGAKVGQ